MLKLAYRNLMRRPLRHAIVLTSLAIAMAVLMCIEAFADSYRKSLSRELDHSGAQLMIVPIGCPYDAAARALKNQPLENSLPLSALDAARKDPEVATAAPLLIAAVPREREKRVDLWVGIDESAPRLKPWWKIKTGNDWFAQTNGVIMGSEAAVIETRDAGDKFFSPETGWEFRIGGVLRRSGTSDDAVFFIPLATAQAMFKQQDRLTAIAVQLRDPAKLRETSERLQKIPGAQVVTMTEVMGVLLNLIGAMRTLVLAVGMISLTVSALTVFNTVLAGVVERAGEFSIMRAVGAALARVASPAVAKAANHFISFAREAEPLSYTANSFFRSFLLVTLAGAAAALYPAWRATRVQPADATRLQ